MKFATIYTLHSDWLGHFYFSGDDGAVKLARECLEKGLYTKHNPIALCDWETGEAAAEEMFDLTNNPGRQPERLVKYGRHRSISVGDIVEAGGKMYACRPCGWQEFTA